MIIKTFKGLQDLEISLDILVETGVGKTVNSFRKHPSVGNLAKSLISHWKKLVHLDNASEPRKRKSQSKTEKETSNKKIRTLSSKPNKLSEKSWSSELSCKMSFSSDKQKKAQSLKDKQRNEEFGSFSGHKSEAKSQCVHKDSSSGQVISKSKCIYKGSDDGQKSLESHSFSPATDKSFKQSCASTSSRKISSSLKREKCGKDPTTMQVDTGLKASLETNSRLKSPAKSPTATGEDFELPTMSFESYLNYDDRSSLCRRKRKTCPADQQVANASQKSVALATDEKERKKLKLEKHLETPRKKAKISLQDLLNIPLPKVLPELTISFPHYAAETKAPPDLEVPKQKTETTQFTGRRSNSKMQVYSGSKMVYLSEMLTLYEQCIRVLQNHIDSLHEVGGVPFEILEPVLARCTPAQLFQIEGCNPTFVEESDHLWKRHCQKDFRNEQLLEYESWRQMYLRVSNQWEEKLKSLTKSILSAQSEKPKGRQVKIALAHGIKAPRNIRPKQGIHGTSGLVVQLQSESKNTENQERTSNTSSGLSANKDINVTSSSSSIYCTSTGPNPDLKKSSKKIAPMMRKSVRAFKNRVGPW
ncbi:elongin-A-like isoform X2 [Rhineura floridana]|uniref:elongin-A-like isoform X2 n=1 Tax=Rhineura floridana TaxID=261503 RepID=UPI002AC847D6|nr:elongin-A-like isoform X2 [Rhineura floridana]